MNLQRALEGFLRRVEVIVSLEVGGKLSPEMAYQNIKLEVKELKRHRKNERKTTSTSSLDVDDRVLS